jgi:hypothetical protein
MRLIFLALLPSVAGLSASPIHAQQPVPVGAFRSVELRNGGDVDIVPGPVQRVTLINGNSAMTHFQVRDNGKLEITTWCDKRCPHEYDLKIRIESPNVPDVAVRAGGTIKAAPGFAPQQDLSAAVMEGGTIDLRAVQANQVSAAINAGGDIYVRARRALNAAVRAGGDIHYSGNPQVSMAVAGGGNVSRDD